MRKSEAFSKGKQDGSSGKEPKIVGGKVAYSIGYQIGRAELDLAEITRKLNEKHRD